MHTHPYETTPCSSYNLEKIEKSVKEAQINGNLYLTDNLEKHISTKTESLYAVFNKNDSEIPAFAHPLVIRRDDQEPTTVVDLRGFVRENRDGSHTINAKIDLGFTMLRAALTQHWANEGIDDLRTLGDFPLTVFIRWLGDSISRRLAVSPDVQIRIAVITGYYYLHQFVVGEPSERERHKMATQITRATHLDVETVLSIGDEIGKLSGVHSYCHALRMHSESIRMKDLNAGLLYSIIGGGWFGANAREIIAVAVEHPPTYVAMIYYALVERGYRKSQFSQRVEASDKHDAGKQFVRNIKALAFKR